MGPPNLPKSFGVGPVLFEISRGMQTGRIRLVESLAISKDLQVDRWDEQHFTEEQEKAFQSVRSSRSTTG